MVLKVEHDRLMVLDFETFSEGPKRGLEMFRKDARAVSCAFFWQENGVPKAAYRTGEKQIRHYLLENCTQRQLIAHSLQFEYMVLKCRFPEFPQESLVFDTMRMVQVADGGGEEFDYFAKRKAGIPQELIDLEAKEVLSTHGVNLQRSARRWLDSDFQDHKAPAHQWLRDHGVKKGQEGSHLHYLPPDLLASYNIADVQVTWELFHRLLRHFEENNYNWLHDHHRHNFIARLNADAEMRGVVTDRERLEEVIHDRTTKVSDVYAAFREQHLEHILKIEEETGKPFNLRSKTHMKRLFVDALGLPYTHKTASGAPSFAKDFLGQWGDAAKHLVKRGTYEQVKAQATNAWRMSEYDGRTHFRIHSVGTRSGRFKAGDGSN